MNEFLEQTFNSIYEIFVENDLISKNDDNEQEKKNKKLFRSACHSFYVYNNSRLKMKFMAMLNELLIY